MRKSPETTFLLSGTIVRFVLTAILIAAYALTYVMFMKNSQLADNYSEVTKIIALFLSGTCSYIPFTVAEVLVIVILTVFGIYLAATIFKMVTNGAVAARIVRIISNIAVFTSFGVFLFMAVFGSNYFCTPLSSKMELNVRPSSVEELKTVTMEMLEKANEYSEYIPRDENGYTRYGSFETMAERTVEGIKEISEQYAFLGSSYAPVKSLNAWKLMARFGIAGIYIPFTGEAIVNPDTPAPGIMFHMAHEMAHRSGIAPEDEANFIAYLACRENPDRRAKYSAYFMAYRYCINALYSADRASANEIQAQVGDKLRIDLIQLNENIEKYEGVMQDAGEKINDTYLKSLSQESGTKSYGMMVDLLIAEYYDSLEK